MKEYDSDSIPKRALRILVYGDTGVGKTYFASTFPNPVFLMNGRNGDFTLRGKTGVKLWQIETDDDMAEAIARLQVSKQFDTVVLDTVTYHADAAMETLSGSENKKRVTEMNQMQQRDWGKLSMYFTQSLQPTLHKLPMHVVYVAMTNRTYERDRSGESKLTKVEPAIPGSSRERLPGKCDIVGYMHCPRVIEGGKAVNRPRLVVRPSDEVSARWPGLPDSESEIAPSFDEIIKRCDWIERFPNTAGKPTVSTSPSEKVAQA